jgi:hypothetical protein
MQAHRKGEEAARATAVRFFNGRMSGRVSLFSFLLFAFVHASSPGGGAGEVGGPISRSILTGGDLGSYRPWPQSGRMQYDEKKKALSRWILTLQ